MLPSVETAPDAAPEPDHVNEFPTKGPERDHRDVHQLMASMAQAKAMASWSPEFISP